MSLTALALGMFVGLLVASLAAMVSGGRRLRRLGERLHRHVEPYLRRKAAEAGLETPPRTFSARTPPEEIVDHVAGLAERLLERERRGQGTGAGDSLGLAATQPVASDDA